MKSKKTQAVTDRFIQAMNAIIYENVQDGGEIKTESAFSISIGSTPQNFHKIINRGQDVTARLITTACEKYRINPTWLHLNEGDMFLKEIGNDITSVPKQLRSIADKLEQNQSKQGGLKRRA